ILFLCCVLRKKKQAPGGQILIRPPAQLKHKLLACHKEAGGWKPAASCCSYRTPASSGSSTFLPASTFPASTFLAEPTLILICLGCASGFLASSSFGTPALLLAGPPSGSPVVGVA